MSAERVVRVTDASSTLARASIDAVNGHVHQLCQMHAKQLPFHGWHHVSFVRAKAVEFAGANGSDAGLVEVAALVHDLNYIVAPNSPASAGRRLRLQILAMAQVGQPEAARVDEIVREAEMAHRHRHISLEAQALSDADTLFKALPVTPVMLAHRYLAENGVSLRELANKIVTEQQDVHDEGYYFYNPEAAVTYSRWAEANLQLWRCIRESLDDPTVEQLMRAVS